MLGLAAFGIGLSLIGSAHAGGCESWKGGGSGYGYGYSYGYGSDSGYHEADEPRGFFAKIMYRFFKRQKND